jgi:NADPH:quinone reductase-like Zn-dependent oxidoreductase
MKVFLISKGSTGFDGLKLAERERPTPGAGQVLVRMRAASLNFRDLAIVAGKYFRGPVTQDTIPLSDGAGEVAAVGAGVTQFKAGDRVVATFTQGNPPAALGLPLDGTLA